MNLSPFTFCLEPFALNLPPGALNHKQAFLLEPFYRSLEPRGGDPFQLEPPTYQQKEETLNQKKRLSPSFLQHGREVMMLLLDNGGSMMILDDGGSQLPGLAKY